VSHWQLAPEVLTLPTPPPSPALSQNVEICLVEFLKTGGKWIENIYCPRRVDTPYTTTKAPGKCGSSSEETWSLYSRESTLSGFSSDYGVGQGGAGNLSTAFEEHMVEPSRHTSPSLD